MNFFLVSTLLVLAALTRANIIDIDLEKAEQVEVNNDNVQEDQYQDQDMMEIGEALTMDRVDGAESKLMQAGLCLGETNAARGQNGRGPLQYDSRLEAAARNHNNVMVSRNCFSHQCPGEPSPGDRVSQTGYQWRSTGENLAAGQGDCRSAVNGWMNSPGHRANILGDNNHVGCAMATCSNCQFRTYWTCVYAKPR